MADKVFKGTGKIFIDGQKIDNPTTCSITVETEDITLPNTGSIGGGNYAKFTRPTAVRIEATVHDYSGSTLSRLLKGTVTDEAPAAVSQDVTAVVGKLVSMDGLLDVAAGVTVTQNAGTWAATTAVALNSWVFDASSGHLFEATTGGITDASEPTWPTSGGTVTDGTVVWTDRGLFAAVADTDFIARAVGVEIVTGAGIPDGAPITVAGTSYGHARLEVMTDSATETVIDVDLVNEYTGEPMVGHFTKGVWDPASVDLIQSGEFGSPTLSAEILQDSSRPTGRSPFGTLRVGDKTIL